MVDFKYPKRHEYHWTHFYCNEILLIISMAILCVCSQAPGRSPGNDDKICSEYTTCKSCTTIVEHGCSWCLKEQKCGNRTIKYTERFTLRDEQSCPNYLVEKLDTYSPSKALTISYNVTMSFDHASSNGHYNFGEAKNITCVMLATRVTIERLPDENKINCTWRITDTAPLRERKAIVYPIVAMVDDVTIKLENDDDYYLTVYDRSCAEDADEYCVTCAWHDSRHRYYNRWCSAKNPCTGRWNRSMVHAVHAGSEVVAGEETTLMCAEIDVQLNGTTSGVVGGGETTVQLTVANHWILREHFTAITVTVAGLDCARRPDTVDDGSNDTTIACTVRAPNDATEGPVRVAYYTSSEKRRYVVASVQPFKFVKPVLMDLRAGYVCRDGQRRLTIFGQHLDAGNEAAVTVDERVACRTVARTSDRIECLIGPADASTAAARASVAFDRSPAVNVDGTVHSGLAALDPQQRFETIASGGILVAVRGRRFAAATPAFMNIDGVRGVFPECRVRNDTYMVCRTPNTRMPLGSVAVLRRNFSIVFLHNHSDSSAMAYSSQSPSALDTYHDPVFVDFHVQDRLVVINVSPPNRGYGTDQLTVRFANTADRCTVTETAADRVLCAPPSSPTVVLADVHRLVVTVGDTFERNVTRKFIAPVDDRNDDWSVTAVVCWTLVVLCSIAFLGFRYGRRYRYRGIMTDHSDLVPLY